MSRGTIAHKPWSRVFRLVPAIALAEPFECFWAIYGLFIAASIVIRERRHQIGLGGALPAIGSPPLGVYLWAAIIALGAVLMAVGLTWAGIKPLDGRPRYIELSGLLVFTAPLAQQVVVDIQHLASGPLWIYQILNIGVLSAFVLGSLVRVIAVASPAGVMAVSRVSRIRLVRKQLDELRKSERERRKGGGTTDGH